MKRVSVHPLVSWTVLGAGMAIALLFVWKAHETIAYIKESTETASAYYQVSR